MNWWANLPLSIDPVAFSIGSFSFRWYSLSWIIGFFAAYVVFHCIQKISREYGEDRQVLGLDEFFWLFCGALFGGRIGFAILYAPGYFLEHPFRLFFPFDSMGNFVGISGMSFFGGVIGVILTLFLFFRGRREALFQAADMIVLSAPIAILFGRLGNFLNGELFGRPTDFFLGMYFQKTEGFLRHPSQLYEAFFEGVVLFGILLFLWKRQKREQRGMLSGYFLILYGVFRFFLEFVREPDPGMGLLFGYYTLGQVYAATAVLIGIGFLLWLKRGKVRTSYL